MKQCSKCKEVKELSEFYKLISSSDGFQSWCKSCISEKDKHYYTKNKDQIKNKAMGYRNSNCFKVRIANYNKSARRKGLEFNLTEEYLESIKVTHCPVFGWELKWDNTGTGQEYNSASLDRIDNSKGYIEGNVQWLSWRANKLKNDSTFEEIEKLYLFLKDSTHV